MFFAIVHYNVIHENVTSKIKKKKTCVDEFWINLNFYYNNL